MSRPNNLATVAICLLCISAPIASAQMPATRPAHRLGTEPPAGEGVASIIRHLRDRAESLQLTQTQRDHLSALFDKAEQDAQAIRQQFAGGRPAARVAQVEALMSRLWTDLSNLLSPAQLESLRQSATTQPFQPLGVPFAQRIRSALDQLELTPDQRSRLSDLTTQFQNRVQAIHREIAAGGQSVRDQATTMLQDFRQEVLAILTPDQQQKLRELMEQSAGPTSAPSRLGRRAQIIAPPASPPSDQKPQTADVTPDPPMTPPPTALVGAVAPQFVLLSPGGVQVKSSSFKGHLLVLEFGSLSAPTFRDHVADMQRLAADYANRVSFLVIYTREAHPAGGDFESARNQADGISVDQPTTTGDRIERAKQTAARLNMRLPYAVDAMDDTITSAYGGFPNATVVIGPDGKIIYRQQWTDPSGLPRVLDDALAK